MINPELLLAIEQADGLYEIENQLNSGGQDDLFHAGNNAGRAAGGNDIAWLQGHL